MFSPAAPRPAVLDGLSVLRPIGLEGGQPTNSFQPMRAKTTRAPGSDPSDQAATGALIDDVSTRTPMPIVDETATLRR